MNHRKQLGAAWHSLSLPDVSKQLDASQHGLSDAEAIARLAEFGPNRLPQKPPTPLWAIVLRQFRSPLIYILAVAAIVSVAIGDVKDAAFIAGVLVLNAVIGAYQEWKAEQSSHALRKLLQIRASVHRDGEVREVAAEEVVPGDVVWLESGNRVPADIRLVSAHGLESDESLLTGESMPVLKDPAWSGTEAIPVADRLNMAYAGAIVTRGRAKGLVVATGTATSVGQLALDVMGEAGGKPPLLVRMERFTRVIAIAVLVAAVSIGIMGVTMGGYSLPDMFMFTVAMAVSAIPEGLPVAMTVALVMGIVGFLTFRWFLPDGASDSEVASARNALLLLMVLFENIHIGNCRSETKSALALSPLRSPILLAGTVTAFLIHLAAMYTPFGQVLLEAEPVALKNWSILFLLALTIFPIMELHKWSWNMRNHEPINS